MQEKYNQLQETASQVEIIQATTVHSLEASVPLPNNDEQWKIEKDYLNNEIRGNQNL